MYNTYIIFIYIIIIFVVVFITDTWCILYNNTSTCVMCARKVRFELYLTTSKVVFPEVIVFKTRASDSIFYKLSHV